jgi:uncharacterized UBP type Zn finger protein
MDPYDCRLVPGPFGQVNTGAVCYFNSLWQMLIGCSAFARAVQATPLGPGSSRTAVAVRDFVDSYVLQVLQVPQVSQAAQASQIAQVSQVAQVPPMGTTAVLRALVADLAERRPAVRFGAGQESASEALVLLLDMMEPPAADAAGGCASAAAPSSLVAQVFRHRFSCTLRCLDCKKDVSVQTDHAINFNLFHFDGLPGGPPATPEAFSRALRTVVEPVTGYRCANCKVVTRAARVYSLKMIPEVLFCAFNLYDRLGGQFGGHYARYFPPRVHIPAASGGAYEYRLVGQVEHSGGLGGGHYWARGLRLGAAQTEGVFSLNDSGVAPATFGASPNTYLVVYHYVGVVDV